MSYILDALRKADAQRERDPARGIHAQPLRGGSASKNSGGGVRPWFWVAVAAGMATVTVASWYFYANRNAAANKTASVQAKPPAKAAVVAVGMVPAKTGTAPATASPPEVAAAAAPAEPSAIADAIEPPAPPAPPAPPPAARSLLAQRDPGATSLPTMRGGPQPGSAAQVPQPPAAPPSAAGVTPIAPSAVPGATPTMPGAFPMAPSMNPQSPAASMAPPPAPPVAPPVPINPPPPPPVPPPVLPPAPPTPPVAGLPADAPKVAISGGVYSANPAQRMLIVNGQVFNEGSEIGPGVVLEQIQSRGSAVLRYRGARYTVRY